MLKNYPIKMLRGTEVKFNNKEHNIIPGIQKVFTDTSYNTAKSLNDMEKIVFRDILQITDYYKRLPTKGRLSGRDRYIKNDRDKEIRRFLKLDTKPNGRRIEKIVIPSNIIDIYTR